MSCESCTPVLKVREMKPLCISIYISLWKLYTRIERKRHKITSRSAYRSSRLDQSCENCVHVWKIQKETACICAYISFQTQISHVKCTHSRTDRDMKPLCVYYTCHTFSNWWRVVHWLAAWRALHCNTIGMIGEPSVTLRLTFIWPGISFNTEQNVKECFLLKDNKNWAIYIITSF